MNQSINRMIDTIVSPKDKVSLSKLKSEIKSYPEGTLIKYAKKGSRINDISNGVYCLVKVGSDQWEPYGSLTGLLGVPTKSSDEVIRNIVDKRSSNIAVKRG